MSRKRQLESQLVQRQLTTIQIGLLVATAVLVAAPVAPAAQPGGGVWFDIGEDKGIYVTSEDSLSWEYFPPFTFGRSYPPGTLVYASVTPRGCELIAPLECGSVPVVASFEAFFYDGGCGCGGWLLESVTLRMAYDDAVVEALGAEEADLGILHYDWNLLEWVALEDVRIDAEANRVEVDLSGWILAEQYYVVTPMAPTPVQPATWGALKSGWW